MLSYKVTEFNKEYKTLFCSAEEWDWVWAVLAAPGLWSIVTIFHERVEDGEKC